jgi:hypothetical protein
VPELPAPGAQAGKPLATPAATIDLSAAGIDELIVAANDHYARAQDNLRAGDWAGYGAEMDALQAALRRLVELTGMPTPAATPKP